MISATATVQHPRLPFGSAQFVGRYLEIVTLVKPKYPKARIALLSSPMVSGQNRAKLQTCSTAIKAKTGAAHLADSRVALYLFWPVQARGCNSHASAKGHAVLAKALAPFFRPLAMAKRVLARSNGGAPHPVIK